MAGIEFIIEINTEWFKEKPDLTECMACGETMVTNTNSLYVFSNNALCSNNPVAKICNSCFNCIDNANNSTT